MKNNEASNNTPAHKSWETRRAAAARRSEAARKANVTRGAAGRSEAARKANVTRKANVLAAKRTAAANQAWRTRRKAQWTAVAAQQ